MNLMFEIVRRARAGAVVSGLAFVLLGGTALAQATQGYSDQQNGGSSTYQGRGTNGGSDVNGSGAGGPRSRQLQTPENNGYNNGATNPGVATVPPPGADQPGGQVNPKYGAPQGTQNPQEYPPAR